MECLNPWADAQHNMGASGALTQLLLRLVFYGLGSYSYDINPYEESPGGLGNDSRNDSGGSGGGGGAAVGTSATGGSGGATTTTGTTPTPFQCPPGHVCDVEVITYNAGGVISATHYSPTNDTGTFFIGRAQASFDGANQATNADAAISRGDRISRSL
jgi:hypothetical protein